MTLAGLRKRPAYLLYHFLWNSLDWVFPPHCAGCGKMGLRWCDDCRASLAVLSPPLCARCGAPLQQSSAVDTCPECTSNPQPLSSLRSVCVYTGKARQALHRLKYGRDIGLGEALAHQMLDLFQNLDWEVDLVTCVPLSRARLRERGYNQAAMLARPIALGLVLPFQPLLLRKTREVPSQVGLSAHDRRRNVQDAFETGGLIPQAKSMLIIDDVTTTGSTLNACARTLIDAGVQQVFGLTFARAGLHDHNQPI
jgi:competence protein ComFC